MLKACDDDRFLTKLDETVDSLKKESDGAPVTFLAHSVSHNFLVLLSPVPSSRNILVGLL